MVHDVIAARANARCPISAGDPAMVFSTGAAVSLVWRARADWNGAFDWLRGEWCWGRLGPAMEGTTVARSSSMYSEYCGSTLGSCHSPCAFA